MRGFSVVLPWVVAILPVAAAVEADCYKYATVYSTTLATTTSFGAAITKTTTLPFSSQRVVTKTVGHSETLTLCCAEEHAVASTTTITRTLGLTSVVPRLCPKPTCTSYKTFTTIVYKKSASTLTRTILYTDWTATVTKTQTTGVVTRTVTSSGKRTLVTTKLTQSTLYKTTTADYYSHVTTQTITDATATKTVTKRAKATTTVTRDVFSLQAQNAGFDNNGYTIGFVPVDNGFEAILQNETTWRFYIDPKTETVRELDTELIMHSTLDDCDGCGTRNNLFLLRNGAESEMSIRVYPISCSGTCGQYISCPNSHLFASGLGEFIATDEFDDFMETPFELTYPRAGRV